MQDKTINIFQVEYISVCQMSYWDWLPADIKLYIKEMVQWNVHRRTMIALVDKTNFLRKDVDRYIYEVLYRNYDVPGQTYKIRRSWRDENLWAVFLHRPHEHVRDTNELWMPYRRGWGTYTFHSELPKGE
jgi:hypothetical protein